MSRIRIKIATAAVTCVVLMLMAGQAEAWRGNGYYYDVPPTPYGYATAYGPVYPGVPFYPGYGPPFYPGYGPPFTSTYVRPYTGYNVYQEYRYRPPRYARRYYNGYGERYW